MTPGQTFVQVGLPMLAFLGAGAVLLTRMSEPWLRRMDRLQGRSEADMPKAKEEHSAPAPTPPKRKFDMEEEWKVPMALLHVDVR